MYNINYKTKYINSILNQTLNSNKQSKKNIQKNRINLLKNLQKKKYNNLINDSKLDKHTYNNKYMIAGSPEDIKIFIRDIIFKKYIKNICEKITTTYYYDTINDSITNNDLTKLKEISIKLFEEIMVKIEAIKNVYDTHRKIYEALYIKIDKNISFILSQIMPCNN